MNATEKPEPTEKSKCDKKAEDHRRILKDLGTLSSVFLVVMGVNILTVGLSSVTVGCALGVFACFIAAEYYRRRGARK